MPIALRKGIRTCTNHPISRFVSYDRLSPSYHAFVSVLDSIQIPTTIQEALKHPEWSKAVRAEINALEKNKTWRITELPHGKRPVGCKWLFTIKYNADDSIERLKARLVAKGFTQSYGIDYQETFAPVAKLNTIRILISLAANQDCHLHQLDIKNAFLNGQLEEEVYVTQPPGFDVKGKESKVYRLRKALYGLKQALRAWNKRIDSFLIEAGFTKCVSEHRVYVNDVDSVSRIILCLYVDDLLITGDEEAEIVKVKSKLMQEFEMYDLGNLSYFLGMEFKNTEEGVFLHQTKYAQDIMKSST